MLGFIHKWTLGLAPPALSGLFEFRSSTHGHSTRQANTAHSRQLVDPLGTSDFWNRSALLSRSVDGLVRVYNRLPDHVASHCSVSDFQSDLTAGALAAVSQGIDLDDLCSLRFL